MESISFDRRKLIRGLIFSLAIGLFVFLLVFLFTLEKDTLLSFRYMDSRYVLLAVGAVFLSIVVEALRIQVVTRAIEEKIGFWESVKIFYISVFLGGITPYFSGSIPGQVFLFVKSGIPLGKATMIATIRPIAKSIIFLILTPVLFFYFRKSLEEYEILSWLLLIMSIFFSIFFIYLFFLAVRNPRKLESFLEWAKGISILNKYLNNPKVQKRIQEIMSQTIQFHMSFNLLWQHPVEIILLFFYTAVYWFLHFSVAPLLLVAMAIHLDYVLVMVIQILIFFILPFLPTPGGSGAAEIGFASLFSFFVPTYLLGIYVGIWRLLAFYLNVLIGAVLSLSMMGNWILREKDRKVVSQGR